ncbi:MAG TPA: glycerol-3-phosphate dehydrogenase [Burkholderiales bacterium]|nr:glycerol-3-phosphate dehydrogenase [Burkholderiales bacterium]
MTNGTRKPFDLFVIGGGINGAGIARDAAGRGLDVALCDMNDFASGTSSRSTKLIHGGLRYLEQYEFRLVREALAERETLLRMAPHIIWPMSFVLPQAPGMRPRWMIRAGLWLYGNLGGQSSLPAPNAITLRNTPEGAPLKDHLHEGFVYPDCCVDDARLVILNIRSAADLGATILPRTRCISAKRIATGWEIETKNELTGEHGIHQAAALINATGPWVKRVINEALPIASTADVKLIKGSHIVVPRLYDGNHAYLLQNDDRRVIFIIPYEKNFSLIGTTDTPLNEDKGPIEISTQEIDYLCSAVNRYLKTSVTSEQVSWTYAGVRALYDDNSGNPSDITRDYVLEVNDDKGKSPVLNIFGGKLTTYRRLAEKALEKLAPFFPAMKSAWTSTQPLPGGDMANADFNGFVRDLWKTYDQLPQEFLQDLARRYGARCHSLLGAARTMNDLGVDFGAGLTEREIDFLIAEEWAMEVDDILWRRTKAGLHMTAPQREIAAAYIHRETKRRC